MNLNLDLIQTALLKLYVIISMLSMGFRLTWTQLQGASHHRGLIGRALLANVVLVPMAAVLLVRLLDMPLALATGLFLAAAAPGAPFAPKLAEQSRGPYPVAVGLMFVLAMVSVVTTPATVAFGLPTEGGAEIYFWPIFIVLVLVQSLPLIVGVTVNSRWPDSTQRWMKPFEHQPLITLKKVRDLVRRGSLKVAPVKIRRNVTNLGIQTLANISC